MLKFRDDCIGGLDMQVTMAMNNVELNIGFDATKVMKVVQLLADISAGKAGRAEAEAFLEKAGYFKYLKLKKKRDQFLKLHPNAREEERARRSRDYDGLSI